LAGRFPLEDEPMKSKKNARGFVNVLHPVYPPDGTSHHLVGESSIVGNYDDALDNPGSSALWIGNHHHLNREEVQELVERLQHWLKTGRLHADDEGREP
jgi:hypothetical protein